MDYQYFDRLTIQGAVEAAILKKLRPTYEVVLLSSSRTDAGVSASANAAVVDVDLVDPKLVTLKLNEFFEAAKLDVR